MNNGLSRREFLKLTGLAGLGTALLSSTSPGLKLISPAKAEEVLEEIREVKHVPNICAMCSTGCGITVRVKNGVVERILGNDSPNNETKICARGNLGVFRLYNPERIKRPLVRDDPTLRGQWAGFRATSWDEALENVASQIRKHIEEGTTPQIGVLGGWIICGYYKPFLKAFMATIKSPNGIGIPAPQCFMPKVIGWKSTVGLGVHTEIMVDYDNVKYLLVIKRNLFGALGIPYAQRLGRRREQVKIVVLDPRMSETAVKADEWIPIRSGTDLAFILAMMNVITKEKLYDEEYLKKYTDAPILLKEDGTPYKIVQDEQSGKKKYYVWDMASNSAKLHEEAIEPALLGEFEVEGIRVKPAFQALVEKVAQYTPEWASEITDVDATTIARIAREFATTKPSAIATGWHDVKHYNSFNLWRSIAVLMALVGGIGRKGGVIMTGAGLANTLNPSSTEVPEMAISRKWAEERGVPLAKLGISYQSFYDAITKGKPYPIKTLFLLGINAIRTLSEAPKWKEACSKLEKLVVFDILPSDVALCADVILPEHTYLERDDPLYGIPQAPAAGVRTRRKAVEPLYDTKHLIDILTGILKKVDVALYEEYFEHLAHKLGLPDPEALKEAYERDGIRGIRRVQAEAKGVDPEILEERGFIIKAPEPTFRQKTWSLFEQGKLATPTGRIEVFSLMIAGLRAKAKNDEVKKMLDPLVTWIPPKIHNEIKREADDEFYMVWGRIPTMTHAGTAICAFLQRLTPEFDKMIWINSAAAERLGIRTGDLVEVVNPNVGEPVRARAFVNHMVREDTIFIAGNWVEGRASKLGEPGPPLNMLTELNYEPITGAAMLEEIKLKVRKVG